VPKKVPSESRLPEKVIDHWPEVFKDIDIEVVPIEYLHSVLVSFNDGRIWEIDIAKSKRQTAEENVESTLEELFRQYDNVIDNVDFRLDTVRLKKDIQDRTRTFMKKRK
jgi:hypothetical protein|tara:strand:- start:2549 stop:2875 length:327 start_codon:yes stop_codon:yes gene_type:complete